MDDIMNIIRSTRIEEPEEPPPLTKKEKQALAKKEKKEKKRLQDLENKRIVLWDEFRRELELSRKTAEKLTEDWREVVSSAKVEEMRSELYVFFEKLDRNLVRKDEVIESIVEDIEHIHEMHKRAYFSHIKTIEYLYDVFKVLADTEREMHDRQSTELVKAFIGEIEDFEKKQKETLENIANIEMNQCIYNEFELKEDYQIYLKRMDERMLQEIHRRYKVKDKILARMQEKYDEIVNFVNDLKNSSYDKTQLGNYKTFMERHKFYTDQFERLDVLESRAIKNYIDLQQEFVHVELESQKKIHNLELEQKYFAKAYNRMKQEKEETFVETTGRLKALAHEGRNVLQFYEKMMKKGERLLCLAADCRKYQTQKEKVVPPESVLETSPETIMHDFGFTIETLKLEEHLDLPDEVFCEELRKMHLFWKRHSEVVHQNIILEEEKRQLEAENAKLLALFNNFQGKAVEPSEVKTALNVTQAGLFSDPMKICPSMPDWSSLSRRSSLSDRSKILRTRKPK